MSDRPWLEDADPSLRLERDLLKRLNSEQPPSGSVDRGWAALSAEIAGVHAIGAAASVASGSAQGTHAAAASSAGVGIATKLVAGVALSGGLLWGGAALLKTQGESTLTAPQLVSTPAHTQPRGVTVAPAAPPSVESQTRDAAESADQPLAPARRAPLATTLAEEGRLLARANALVQSGHARQALDLLHESESRYPQSTLYQEREVLTVEALAASGAKSAAKQRAERFLKRYPNSPHAGKLQTFVQ